MSSTDAEMLGRMAVACRNLQKQDPLGSVWFDWVPKTLDKMAEDAGDGGDDRG